MGYSAQLTKQGFRYDSDGRQFIDRPDNVFELLRFWHWELGGIEEGFTLGDLFWLLEEVDGIEMLSPMLNVDIAALFAEAGKAAEIDPEDRIEFVEVCNRAELSTYQPDPDRPDDPMEFLDEEEAEELERMEDAIAELTDGEQELRIYDATGENPITGEPRRRRIRLGEQYGKWVGPYNLWRDFHGWGLHPEPYEGFFAKNPEIDPNTYYGGFGVSLTPVQNILHYPLRYNGEFELRDDLHGGNVLVKDTISITIGEFIHAIFWDLGFYGSPDERDEFKDELDARIERLRGEEDDSEE